MPVYLPVAPRRVSTEIYMVKHDKCLPLTSFKTSTSVPSNFDSPPARSVGSTPQKSIAFLASFDWGDPSPSTNSALSIMLLMEEMAAFARSAAFTTMLSRSTWSQPTRVHHLDAIGFAAWTRDVVRRTRPSESVLGSHDCNIVAKLTMVRAKAGKVSEDNSAIDGRWL